MRRPPLFRDVQAFVGWWVVAAFFVGIFGGSVPFAKALGDDREVPERLDCEKLDCRTVLPEASRFEQREGLPYATGYDASGERVGWVALSTDLVDIKAYSGKPLVTLVGLRPDGTIAGARVVHHSEPILLIGIPEQALHDFVAKYTGISATERVVVGRAKDSESISLDVVSGATVTVLAQNKTILDTARRLGVRVGVLEAAMHSRGRFVRLEEVWSWTRMVQEGVFGRLTVTHEQMGISRPGAFLDVWFTVADAPQVGRAILGDRRYRQVMGRLKEGENLLIVLGNGTGSFKGSGFVRGGIFDRIRLEQGLHEYIFRDLDYTALSGSEAVGSPSFREAALYIVRDPSFDPGRSFRFVFLGSRFDGKGGFSREFREFSAEHRLPSSVYVVEGGKEEAEEAIWVQAWRNRATHAIALAIWLLLLVAIFAARRWSTGSMRRLQHLHLASMVLSFLMIGLWMRSQPSVTQILTLFDSLVHEWRTDLFLSEPLLFLQWIFIATVSVIWGRGVFCGWVCPYGALTELLFKGAAALGLKRHYELPETVHRVARWLRFAILVVLVAAFLKDSVLGERLAEVEPFKSTFLVPAWTRPTPFLLYWLLLLGLSIVWYRPFCRYVCPLGAGLATINAVVRLSGPYRRRFCSNCTICTRGCEPRAIAPDGAIDPLDCLQCMECEATYRDPKRCPPLVGIERLTSKARRTEQEETRLKRLRRDAERVSYVELRRIARERVRRSRHEATGKAGSKESASGSSQDAAE